MPSSFLKYTLVDGYIHNWLVTGPLEMQIAFSPADPLEATEPPVELGPLGALTQTYPHLVWHFTRCKADHLLDFSAAYPVRRALCAWAYAQVHLPAAQAATLVLASYTPAQVWVNGSQMGAQASSSARPQSQPFPVSLRAGANEIVVRWSTVAQRSTRFAAAVRLEGLAQIPAEVVLPTDIEPKHLELRERLERLADTAYLERSVYGYLDGDRFGRNEPLSLKTGAGFTDSGELTYRMQSPAGDIFQEGTQPFEAGMRIELAQTFPLRSGRHHLALTPPAKAYYIHKLRFERKETFYIVRSPFSQKVSPVFKERVKEALNDAADRRGNSLFSEMARMAAGRWEQVERKNLEAGLERVNQRWDGSAADLLGLLGMLARYGKRRGPIKELKPQILEAAAQYRYWSDEPGDDTLDFESESQQLLFHTCEILAGQILPKRIFTGDGRPGSWHQQHGEELAAGWIRSRGLSGFRDWDSPAALETILAALSHLVELAGSRTIGELAAVLMDKIFFGLAAHSLLGAYGSARGSTDSAAVLSARLEATSGITRLMWRLGNYNDAVMGVVSLALCPGYELPDLIAKIAFDLPRPLWSREHACAPDAEREVNKVSYRTFDYLLSSAQDYYPGRPGRAEHIWQATLGADAIVYTNHPACLSEEDAQRPNLWAGNGVLPRVAQWGDVLAAVYRLPADDWLGYTHAYFPSAAFDEYCFEQEWAFARKGNGYLALRASAGFDFITSGQTAYRELRAPGRETFWLCHMGHETLDGSFAEFRQKILKLDIHFTESSIQLTSLRDDTIAFGWQGPLLVNGQEQPLTGFPHCENDYCTAALPAAQMDIIYQDQGIRLKFE